MKRKRKWKRPRNEEKNYSRITIITTIIVLLPGGGGSGARHQRSQITLTRSNVSETESVQQACVQKSRQCDCHSSTHVHCSDSAVPHTHRHVQHTASVAAAVSAMASKDRPCMQYVFVYVGEYGCVYFMPCRDLSRNVVGHVEVGFVICTIRI